MKNGITVLSLFDGMSCGRIALDRCGIKIDTYYASEIDKNAIKVAMHNYSDTVQLGNITKITYKNGILQNEDNAYEIGKIDLIIGGSPCTNFSRIGNNKGMTSENGVITTLEQYLVEKENNREFQGESYLFWEYVRLLREVKPTFFLLENVVMSKKWSKIITDNLGVEPIEINSSLVSAQNRRRMYWTNIKGVNLPEDKQIKLKDILLNTADISDVSDRKTVQKVIPKLEEKYGYVPECFNAYNVVEVTDKACTLTKGSMITSSCATLLFVKEDNGVHRVENGILDGLYNIKLCDGRYNIRQLSVEEMELLQTVPIGYTKVDGVSNQKRTLMLGNGWTVDVIAHILSFLKV